MSWNGLERNKLDYILTDLLPVELSELFSFRQFYNFLLEKEQQNTILGLVENLRKNRAKGNSTMFEHGWGTQPLKYNILKGSDSSREMSVIQPFSALNLFLFMECYQKDILNLFDSNHCFSIRYYKKSTDLYYKVKSKKVTQYFKWQSKRTAKGALQQTGNYFKITPFESINSFADARIWRMCNFKYRYYAKIDYKSCFDSIYTHVYKWIIERNVVDSKAANNSNLFITIDRILQNINGLSSNGLIVGPEFSRMIAEVLLQQIDSEVLGSLSNDGIEHNREYVVFRYVDDIFMFANAQDYIDKIIEKYKLIGERYLLRLNDLKLIKGETPCLPKVWLEKTRYLSDIINNFFYKGKKENFDKFVEDEYFLIKPDFISVDRVKDEITVLMKKHSDDRRTIVSFLLSTLLNNISKKKDGYMLFGQRKLGKSMLLIDMAMFIFAFCPSFDQTRKIISMIVYMNDEVNFKNDDIAKRKLNSVIQRYSFVFQSGNIFDLCDWFPFLSEYSLSFDVATENTIIEKANELKDPIIWGNILLYSKYYAPFFDEMKSHVEKVIDEHISRISDKEQMLQREFWYILIFHNCPYISATLKNKIDNVIIKIMNSIPITNQKPSEVATKLMCDFLQNQPSSSTKPEESLFNWKGIPGISEQITYRTYQRTIFKRYRKNNYSLYASLD